MPVPPTATEDKRCECISYDESVRDALAWRKALGVETSRGQKKEEEIARRLAAVNAQLGEGYNSLADKGEKHGLVDSLLVLRVAAIVMREHEEPLLEKRFELEAAWVEVWLKDATDEHGLVHDTILEWWWEVAGLWTRNARSIVGPILVKEEPFATLFQDYSWRNLKGLQGLAWYKGKDDEREYAPFDAFYSLECVKSQDPWLWLKFKAMPLELCGDSTPSRDDLLWAPHPGMNGKIEKLIKELVGE